MEIPHGIGKWSTCINDSHVKHLHMQLSHMTNTFSSIIHGNRQSPSRMSWVLWNSNLNYVTRPSHIWLGHATQPSPMGLSQLFKLGLGLTRPSPMQLGRVISDSAQTESGPKSKFFSLVVIFTALHMWI